MIELTVGFKCPPAAEKKAIYILNLIASITGLRFKRTDTKPDITYGTGENSCGLCIPCIDYSINLNDWHLFNKKSRFILPEFISFNLFEVKERKIGLDILSLMFEFLRTGLENHKESIWSPDKIKSGSYYIYPFLNSYVDFFIQALKSSGLISEVFQNRSPWPNGAKYAIGLSHDIDIFKRKLFGSLAILAKSVYSDKIPGGVKGSLTGLADSVKTTLPGKTNPYRMTDKWLETDGHTTFFVYSGNRKSSLDPTYKPVDVYKVLGDYKNRPYEIGLHNGIGTWSNKSELESYKNRLSEIFNTEIHGLRPHYLDCSYPGYWDNAKSFAYSSSVGSDSIPGFTCGINFPFFGFDFETGDAIDILEIPIGIMDGALFSLSDKMIRERTIDHILKSCLINHGLLVLDWHNRTMYEPDFPGWLETYISILEKAKSAGAYIAPLNEINRRWRDHCVSVFLS